MLLNGAVFLQLVKLGKHFGMEEENVRLHQTIPDNSRCNLPFREVLRKFLKLKSICKYLAASHDLTETEWKGSHVEEI